MIVEFWDFGAAEIPIFESRSVYTSKKCSCCKVIQKVNRKKSKYHCKHCNFQLHADWNAAINIKDNYISSTSKTSEEQAAVIQPYVTIGNNQSQAYCLVQ